MTHTIIAQAKGQVEIYISDGENYVDNQQDSRLDLKIKREQLMASDNVGKLWGVVWTEIQNAAEKVNRQWAYTGVDPTLNDDNSVITLKAKGRDEGGPGLVMPHVEIRLDRRDGKILVRAIHSSESSASHVITPDAATENLLVGKRTARDFAEHVVAEKLCGMRLD